MITIYKIGLAVIENKKLLLCEPLAFKDLIILGGIKEGNESPLENLTREINEELGSNAVLEKETLIYLGNFKDRAAGKSERTVEIELYMGSVSGQMIASSEIRKIHWIGRNDDLSLLSPIVKNQIFPFLVNNNYL